MSARHAAERAEREFQAEAESMFGPAGYGHALNFRPDPLPPAAELEDDFAWHFTVDAEVEELLSPDELATLLGLIETATWRRALVGHGFKLPVLG